MPLVEVLKFGSSVLRSADDLHIAVDEIYRRWRSGYHVLVAVSAFEGITDQLIGEASKLFGSSCTQATATYVATGEQRTAALLTGMLERSGIPARIVEPREIGLLAAGPGLESAPVSVDIAILREFWRTYPILVLPGFYGVDDEGNTALFGRGGSDLSALFLAAELGGGCRLLKDVNGVFDADPASHRAAHRFSALSWERAIDVAGPLIQPKALRYAQSRELRFEVGRPNEHAGTAVGEPQDQWARPASPSRPIRIALLGCGVVGRGVYEMIRRYPKTFEIRHVVVGNMSQYTGIENLTNDANVALHDSIDLVIEAIGGLGLPYTLIPAALGAGKYVITANKALMAAHWPLLSTFAQGPQRRLWYSAAVGGALPVIESLAASQSVCAIRGIINGTCGIVLDAWTEGKTREEAIVTAQAGGYAEADPTRDLSGLDSADKLALMVEAAFGTWLAPERIPTRGIDTITGDPKGYKLIARAQRARTGVINASVSPELLPPDSFLGQATGAENRLEIELTTGDVIRLRGQGAGRWPTTTSVLGDLHEVARLREAACLIESPSLGVNA